MDELCVTAREAAERLVASVREEQRAGAAKLAWLCTLADLYRSVKPLLEMPGGPVLEPAGADGTVDVDDFLVEEVHALLGIGPAAAWALVRDACNLRDRHPRAWALLQEGAIPVRYGIHIAQACQHLDREGAGYVDEKIASSLTTLPWVRVRRRLAGLIVRADAELAAERLEAARRERFVRIQHTSDGTSWVTARIATPDAVLLGEAIDNISRSIVGDPGYMGSLDQARAEALGVLVTPGATAGTAIAGAAKRRADALLVVHLNRDDVAQPEGLGFLGRVEGPRGLDDIGPVLLSQVRELVAHRQVKVLPLIDLADDPAVDAWEVPEPLRRRIALRDRYSVFPFATRHARSCDADHTIPWTKDGPPGQTRPSNLGPLHRSAHRAKTHGGWKVTQPAAGVFNWTSPLGYRYRVDDQGTHRIEDDRPPRPRAAIQPPITVYRR